MTAVTLSVPDISCGHCKTSIEGALTPLEGVDRAEVHVAERTVDVAFDGNDRTYHAIVEAIEDQGYEVAVNATN